MNIEQTRLLERTKSAIIKAEAHGFEATAQALQEILDAFACEFGRRDILSGSTEPTGDQKCGVLKMKRFQAV